MNLFRRNKKKSEDPVAAASQGAGAGPSSGGDGSSTASRASEPAAEGGTEANEPVVAAGADLNAGSDAKSAETAPSAPAAPPRPMLRDREQNPVEESIVAVLKTIYDPEIPVDIYELGLIYDLTYDETGQTRVRMTLTSPACPVAGSLPGDVERKVLEVPGVTRCEVDLVWDPPWNPSLMSEAARLTLNF